ncbi:helix-turn-helix domain-containing protein [Streptomyces sp. NPDC006307]|uniref:RICIN domain-containing protein n=1 Tax=Streptomyces sp. NPDC006307 TaxID=3156748 RepID=UPI0033A2CB68
MTDGERAAPDPREARDPVAFIALLQDLKDWSGLTYRELSARAEALGEVLPRSTVANMLARTTVPREELLSAFVRACGVGPEALESWLSVRKELAVRARGSGGESEDTAREPWFELPPEPEPEPEPEGWQPEGPGTDGRGDAWRAWFVPLVAVLALVVAATTVVAFLLGGEDEHRREDAAAPAPGPVLIRAVHSGLCLNERPGQQSGQVYQVPCAEATVPRYSLVRLDGGLWRIRSDHPDFGPGCSGIPVEAVEQDGAPLIDQQCGKRGPREAFRIEEFGGGDGAVAGYRIRSAHADLCLRVRDASREPWTDVIQEACREDGEGQLFSLDPADAT